MSRQSQLKLLGGFVLLVLPWALLSRDLFQELYNLNSAGFYVLVILSLVLLTGWVGQISLAHAALVGVGTYTAANVSQDWGWAFPLQLLAAGVAGGAMALLIGLPSLRLRGLYLAVATLAFQWMAEQSVFQWRSFTGGYEGSGADAITLPGLGVNLDGSRLNFRDNQEWLYYVVLALVCVTMVALANLRDTRTGRAFFAIRDSEMAARSLGIDVMRYKLIAFVTSGFLAGMAGAVLANQIDRVSIEVFTFTRSIGFVVFAIIGGIGLLAGAVVAGVAFMFGEVVQSNVDALRGYINVFAGSLVIITVLQNPDGLVALPARLRHEREERRLKKRLGVEELEDEGIEEETVTDLLGKSSRRSAPRRRRQTRTDAVAVLAAEEVTVRFGGVVANEDVAVEVREGEIVGLIGPNGAGKTTFFNAVSGFVVPRSGRITAMGTDLSGLPVHRRAALGMGRTFQGTRLLPRLTVDDNLLVATHLANRSGFFNDLALTARCRVNEASAREKVDEVAAFLGLETVRGHLVADLPFGVLRMVELGRALVAEPKLLLLDEPASGLDSEETERFGEILLEVRDRLGISMLLIEHDVGLVMAVSDYVYVLDFGRLLTHGLAADVQADPAVIAAYLGEEVAHA
jgi:ABC-type branched-subunit amino acid transport system ATPase component/ABC-type branched-subunit amino acid transport system permease subunit